MTTNLDIFKTAFPVEWQKIEQDKSIATKKKFFRIDPLTGKKTGKAFHAKSSKEAICKFLDCLPVETVASELRKQLGSFFHANKGAGKPLVQKPNDKLWRVEKLAKIIQVHNNYNSIADLMSDDPYAANSLTSGVKKTDEALSNAPSINPLEIVQKHRKGILGGKLSWCFIGPQNELSPRGPNLLKKLPCRLGLPKIAPGANMCLIGIECDKVLYPTALDAGSSLGTVWEFGGKTKTHNLCGGANMTGFNEFVFTSECNAKPVSAVTFNCCESYPPL